LTDPAIPEPTATVQSVTEQSIAATVHGRYLTIPPTQPGPAPLLVGFHGYAEDAETQLKRLRAIPDSTRWLCVSIQALHRFYQRRTDHVVASWMTRQDREAAIVDNLRYVEACIDAVAAKWPTLPTIVYAGFSQGAGMAYRAAANSTRPISGVIAVGGDIPPEIPPHNLSRVPAVILARGTADGWYKKEKFAEDAQRLLDCSVTIRTIEFEGGHEWSDPVTAAVDRFLRESYPESI
jgi:predicted esterase